MTPTPLPARRALVAAALLAAAFAAGCGNITHHPGQGAVSSRTSLPTTPATTAGPATTPPAITTPATPAPATTAPAVGADGACPTSALSVAVNTANSGAAAGSVYYPLDFTNISRTTCTLSGYPQVWFADGEPGRPIGSPASRNRAGRPLTVTLAPGGLAHATLQVGQAGNYSPSQCRPVTAHWLLIRPPGQAQALYARLTAQACSATLPRIDGDQLSISAIRGGAGGNTP